MSKSDITPEILQTIDILEALETLLDKAPTPEIEAIVQEAWIPCPGSMTTIGRCRGRRLVGCGEGTGAVGAGSTVSGVGLSGTGIVSSVGDEGAG